MNKAEEGYTEPSSIDAYRDTPSETVPEHYDVATTIVREFQEEVSGTLGTLLTQAEAVLGGDPRLKPFKDQIRREFQLMRYRIQDSVYYNLGVQKQRFMPGNVYLDRPAE